MTLYKSLVLGVHHRHSNNSILRAVTIVKIKVKNKDLVSQRTSSVESVDKGPLGQAPAYHNQSLCSTPNFSLVIYRVSRRFNCIAVTFQEQSKVKYCCNESQGSRLFILTEFDCGCSYNYRVYCSAIP